MKLSIITVNLNNCNGLKTTIDSTLNQTYKDFEYIIIDGGSTDGSVDIIKKYSNKIDYWTSEPDTGIYNAMNKGIKVSNGEYLLFLNSGDYLFNENILSEIFRMNYKEDLIYGNQCRISPRYSKLIKFPPQLTFYHFYTAFIAHNCAFISKKLFDIIGLYNENYKIAADHEFFTLAVCKYNCSYLHINSIVSCMISGGISNQKSSKDLILSERNKIIEKHFSSFKRDYEELYNYKYNSISKRIKRIIKKSLYIQF